MYTVNRQQKIVVSNMPVDTGFMRQNGAQSYDMGNGTIKTKYDIIRVPYIPIQEEGPGPNQYFIRNKTVAAINAAIAFEKYGQRSENSSLTNDNLVQLGAVQKINGSMR